MIPIVSLFVRAPRVAAEPLRAILERSQAVTVRSVGDGGGVVVETGACSCLLNLCDDDAKMVGNRPILIYERDIDATAAALPNLRVRGVDSLLGGRIGWVQAEGLDILLLQTKDSTTLTPLDALIHWEHMRSVSNVALDSKPMSNSIPPPTPISTHKPPVAKGQILPSILPSLLIDGEYRPMYANSDPVWFSNELFEGWAVCMVNSSLPMSEPFASKWKDDKNTFEVQVQGRFKQKVPGVLFVGAEITKKMELGLLTRSLCGSILSFCRRYSSLLHSSFGDKANIELPHIVSPLWNTVDLLVVTPTGHVPPPMLQRFPEPEDQRRARKKDHNFSVEIDLDATYSFSLKTMFMDLERWAMVNIPLMNPMNLQTFWSDADLRFLAYAIDGLPALHRVCDQRRLFSLQVQHRNNHVADWHGESSTQFYADGAEPSTQSAAVAATATGTSARLGHDDGDNDSTSDSADDEFHDATDGAEAVASTPVLSPGPPVVPAPASPSLERLSGPFSRPRWRVEAALELDDPIKSALSHSKRRTLYAFFDGVDLVALKGYRECNQILPLSKEVAKAPHFSRCSKAEQRRQILDISYRSAMAGGRTLVQAKVQAYLDSPPRVGAVLLQGSLKAPAHGSEVRCLLLQGNSSWSQEVMSVAGPELLFCRRTGGAQVRLRVLLQALLEVHAVDRNEAPLPVEDLYTLVLSTFSRQYVVVLRGLEVVQHWERMLSEASACGRTDISSRHGSLLTRRLGERSVKKTQLVTNANPADLLCRPTTWVLGDRVLLNGRNFARDHPRSLLRGHRATSPQLLALVTQPAKLSAALLVLAFDVAAAVATGSEATDGSEISAGGLGGIPEGAQGLWLDFLDGVSLLQVVDLSPLDPCGDEAVATLLNVFHTLLIHASLVVGTPSSLFTFQAFFRTSSYEAFGDVLSLAELEHRAIRRAMGAPNVGFLAQALLPGTSFAFGLGVRDVRLLWAVNCASLSTLASVPVYEPAHLHEQLDQVVRLSLAQQLRVADGTVTLPQVCQWHHRDLERSVDPDASGPKALLSALLPFLSEDVRAEVRGLLAGNVSVRYAPFDLCCRVPTQL